MLDVAEYCGPLESLKGLRAAVYPDDSYDRPLEERTLRAQFYDVEGVLLHPETGDPLNLGWHTFPAAHFKILVMV